MNTTNAMREAFEAWADTQPFRDASATIHEWMYRAYCAALSHQPAAEGWNPRGVGPFSSMDELLSAAPTPPQGQPEARHASDCSVHNMPAYPNGPCDCGVEQPEAVEQCGVVSESVFVRESMDCGIGNSEYAEYYRNTVITDRELPTGTKLYTLSPTAIQVLRMAADVCAKEAEVNKKIRDSYPNDRDTYKFFDGGITACQEMEEAILALIPPAEVEFTDEQLAMFNDNAERYGLTTEVDQRKLGFAEGVKAVLAIGDKSEDWRGKIHWSFLRHDALKLTPPTDTDAGHADLVTMTRDTVLEIAQSACLAGAREAQDECLGREDIRRADIHAIVAQHMPKEGK